MNEMHERIEEGENNNTGNVFILDLFSLKLHSYFALDFPSTATNRPDSRC